MSAWVLTGETHFLVLRRSFSAPNKRELEFYNSFSEALAQLGEDSRISPVFPFRPKASLKLRRISSAFVIFAGPVSPADIELPKGASAYLTLGLYNVALVSRSGVEWNKIRRSLKAAHVPHEAWKLKEGVVCGSPEIYTTNHSEEKSFQKIRQPLAAPPFNKHLRDAAQEYLVQISDAVACSSQYLPQHTETLIRFDSVFRKLLGQADLGDLISQRHGLLVNANAALSRQTEQTFAGTSPILERAGHFATHSLLGIGLPSLALTRLSQHVDAAFREARFLERFQFLSESPAAALPLTSMEPAEPFLKQDHLCSSFVEKKLSKATSTSVEDRLPCLTFYSGRDGFRSHYFTVSAPLEMVGSANTAAWTPLTLTHEISHILVGGIIDSLLPQPNDEKGLGDAIRILSAQRYTSMREQMLELLCVAIWSIHSSPEGTLTSEALASYISQSYMEVNEILTHCFDFLYFYQKDALNYVKSVWDSWDVIPNIGERVPDYVIRTLCALHTINMERNKSYEVTIAQLKANLELLRAEPHHSIYIDQAIDLLSDKKEVRSLIDSLQKRELLIRFARHFLYSPGLVPVIMRDDILASSNSTDGHGGYPLKWLRFTHEGPNNPIRFVTAYSRDREADAPKSAWLLANIAFSSR